VLRHGVQRGRSIERHTAPNPILANGISLCVYSAACERCLTVV